MLSFRERILGYLSPRSVTLHTRQYLAHHLSGENRGMEINKVSSGSALFVNGRCIMTKQLAKALRKTASDTLFVSNDGIVAAFLSGTNLDRANGKLQEDLLDLAFLDGLSSVEVEASLVRYPWDVIYANEQTLLDDFLHLTRGRKLVSRKGNVHSSAVLINKRNILIGRQSIVSAGAVLDADSGPIYIGNNVKIFPTAVIEGPCFIGDGSFIKIGAKIYGNTSIGPVCKVGGEVEHSILQSHVNKQHDGFLGHSYLGQWVNLGAGTTTSNLKNTYGNIRVHMDGRPVDSGKMFLGLIAGDHVKTGINATVDTGTVIGPSSNIYGTALPPKFVPAFSWGRHLETYDVEKALLVATKVMGRRNVTASPAYEEVLRHVFSMTAHERSNRRD